MCRGDITTSKNAIRESGLTAKDYTKGESRDGIQPRASRSAKKKDAHERLIEERITKHIIATNTHTYIEGGRVVRAKCKESTME